MVWFDSNKYLVVYLISENYVIEIKLETTLFLSVSWTKKRLTNRWFDE